MPVSFFVSLPETSPVVGPVGIARAVLVAIALVTIAVVSMAYRVVAVAVAAILKANTETAFV